MPYSLRIVCGFFYVPLGCETGSTVYSPYPRRLESLIIKAALTFSSVILKPLVLARPESNSRPPAWQPDAQPTESRVLGDTRQSNRVSLFDVVGDP